MTPRLDVTLSDGWDEAALETLWRANERAFGASFFQTWTWIGCLFALRFTDPVLLRAHDGAGALVAFALFNRRRRWGIDTLHLHESGDAVLDSVYIEHNGILIAPGAPPGTLRDCIDAARTAPIGGSRPRLARRIVLSGVTAGAREQAYPGKVIKAHVAPYADFRGFLGRGDLWLASLRANTRQQIARARRAYEQSGPVVAETLTLADAAPGLNDLIRLHQQSWTSRGQPGAFAHEFVRRFHHTLLARGHAGGSVTIRRVANGGEPFAYLYDFQDQDGVRAYQSGLVFGSRNGRALQPGLVAHATTMFQIACNSVAEYDFLGGDAQYKRMLSNSERSLIWKVYPSFSVLARRNLASAPEANCKTALHKSWISSRTR